MTLSHKKISLTPVENFFQKTAVVDEIKECITQASNFSNDKGYNMNPMEGMAPGRQVGMFTFTPRKKMFYHS